jgi:hypothetical protein
VQIEAAFGDITRRLAERGSGAEEEVQS